MNKRILITVSGGVAEVDQSSIPEGIEVEIRDYDCDGCDNIKKDDYGSRYVEYVWSRVI